MKELIDKMRKELDNEWKKINITVKEQADIKNVAEIGKRIHTKASKVIDECNDRREIICDTYTQLDKIEKIMGVVNNEETK